MRYLLSISRSFSHRLVVVPSAIAVMFGGLIIGVPEVKADSQCFDEYGKCVEKTGEESDSYGEAFLNGLDCAVTLAGCCKNEVMNGSSDNSTSDNDSSGNGYGSDDDSSGASNNDPTDHYDYSEGICKLP